MATDREPSATVAVDVAMTVASGAGQAANRGWTWQPYAIVFVEGVEDPVSYTHLTLPTNREV